MKPEYIKKKIEDQKKTLLAIIVVIVLMIIRSIVSAFFPDFFQSKFFYSYPMVFTMVWGGLVLGLCQRIDRGYSQILEYLAKQPEESTPTSKDES